MPCTFSAVIGHLKVKAIILRQLDEALQAALIYRNVKEKIRRLLKMGYLPSFGVRSKQQIRQAGRGIAGTPKTSL